MNQRPEAEPPKAPQEWERFESFAKRLLAVPVEEIRGKQAENESGKVTRVQKRSNGD